MPTRHTNCCNLFSFAPILAWLLNDPSICDVRRAQAPPGATAQFHSVDTEPVGRGQKPSFFPPATNQPASREGGVWAAKEAFFPQELRPAFFAVRSSVHLSVVVACAKVSDVVIHPCTRQVLWASIIMPSYLQRAVVPPFSPLPLRLLSQSTAHGSWDSSRSQPTSCPRTERKRKPQDRRGFGFR